MVFFLYIDQYLCKENCKLSANLFAVILYNLIRATAWFKGNLKCTYSDRGRLIKAAAAAFVLV